MRQSQFASGSAFRRSLEQRLLTQSQRTGLPLQRLRKLVSFERLIARLILAEPGMCVLKGGVALQVRLGNQARATQDVDLLALRNRDRIGEWLAAVVHLELEDWFTFEAERVEGFRADEFAERWRVHARADGRQFETFLLDVGVRDALASAPEMVTLPSLLSFDGHPPLNVPCYPLPQHIAEKLHAYVQPRVHGENTRVKDLVDLLLISRAETINGRALRSAIDLTFSARNQVVPTALPNPPTGWRSTYRKYDEELNLDVEFDEALAHIRMFVDPVLADTAFDKGWQPGTGWIADL